MPGAGAVALVQPILRKFPVNPDITGNYSLITDQTKIAAETKTDISPMCLRLAETALEMFADMGYKSRNSRDYF